MHNPFTNHLLTSWDIRVWLVICLQEKFQLIQVYRPTLYHESYRRGLIDVSTILDEHRVTATLRQRAWWFFSTFLSGAGEEWMLKAVQLLKLVLPVKICVQSRCLKPHMFFHVFAYFLPEKDDPIWFNLSSYVGKRTGWHLITTSQQRQNFGKVPWLGVQLCVARPSDVVRSGKRKEVSCFSQHTIKYMIIRCLTILVHGVMM